MIDSSNIVPIWIGESNIKYLTGIDFRPDTIHFFTETGRETEVFNSLSLFLLNYGSIVKGDQQIIISLKS